MLLRVLIGVGPLPTRRKFVAAFERAGAIVTPVQSGQEFWTRLTKEELDMVVLGSPVLTDPPGPLIDSIRQLPDRPEIVVVRRDEDPEERAALLAAGVQAVLWEKLTEAALTDAIQALTARRRSDAAIRLRADRPQERYGLNDFVSASVPMQQFITVARRVAASESTVLIQGETGVGKERLARALHNEGPRARGPFIAINCGAFPEGVLESELFGHEQGAFTGASRARRGYFELAHRGTIFLDEVADIPAHLQSKLLRVLEERTIRRLGGERESRIDVRVMAATNRDLEVEAKAGHFRLDLFYRLAVVTVTIPPLRDRRGDIPELAQNYVNHFRVALHVPIYRLTDGALRALCRYSWPGNVRELINVIERAMILCESESLDLCDLPAPVANEAGLPSPQAAGGDRRPFDDALLDQPLLHAKERVVRDFEYAYLTALLGRTGGRVGDAARRAGVNVRSIHEMMKRHGLHKESFKG